MDRIAAVELIIKRHQAKANLYSQLSKYHEEKVKEFEDYKYHLSKPGFKTKGWNRMAKPGRTEPYVVQHGNTVDETLFTYPVAKNK